MNVNVAMLFWYFIIIIIIILSRKFGNQMWVVLKVKSSLKIMYHLHLNHSLNLIDSVNKNQMWDTNAFTGATMPF